MQSISAMQPITKSGREKAMKRELCRFVHKTGLAFAGFGYNVTKPSVVKAKM